MTDELRGMQAFGREELANPVAEALRVMSQPVVRKECYNCEHYLEEEGWCTLNDMSATSDDCCDEYEEV